MMNTDITCSKCGKKLDFLIQLNAPTSKAYYRYIYLFACLHGDCGKGFRAFRTQLPQANAYFDEESEKRLLVEAKNTHLSSPLLPCFEIESYPLDIAEYTCINAHNDDIDELFHYTYHQNKKPNGTKKGIEPLLAESGDTFDDSDFFPEMENADIDFMIYKNNIAADPDQILRYCFKESTKPLYYAGHGKFDSEGRKNCENCGAKRIFEFQINSTLLSMVERLSNFEWGIVAIYSCANSCFGPDYAEEVVRAQFDSDLAKTPPQEENISGKPPKIQLNEKANISASLIEEVNEEDWN